MSNAIDTWPNTTIWRCDVPGGPAMKLAGTGRLKPFANATMTTRETAWRTPAIRL